MNEHLMRARMAAFNAQPGTPIFDAACSVCLLRGEHPNNPHQGAGLLQWQAVIVEQALCKLIQEEVRT